MVITPTSNATEELTVLIGIPTNETKATTEIKVQPVTVETKINNF